MTMLSMTTGMVPATVEIGPFVYDVSLDETDIDSLVPDALAATDPTSLLIALEPAQDEGQLRDSLLHEVLHAITFTNGLANDIEPELLENIINRMSPMLLDVLRDNPQLVAFLLA